MGKGFLFIIVFLFLGSHLWAEAEIKAINFTQKGEVSLVEIVFDKNNVQVEKTNVLRDKQVILDIIGARGPKRVLRPFDSSEFSGSVVFVSPYSKGDGENTRIDIQLRENVKTTLKRGDKKIILEIENRYGAFSSANPDGEKGNDIITPADQSPRRKNSLNAYNVPRSENIEDILENLTLSGKKKYIGRKVTLNAKDLSVSDILRALAESSGFSIILTKEVKDLPSLTLTLTDRPWDQILDTILSMNKLVVTKNGSILLVKTLTAATKDKEQEEKNRLLSQKQEPRVTKVIPLSYAQTTEIIKILKEYITPPSIDGGRDGGTISEDLRTNSIIVKDTISSLDRIVKIVEVLDLQTPQVLIESKIVEVEESYSKNLGLDGGFGYGYDPIGTPATSSGNIGEAVGGGLDAGAGFSFNTAGGALATGGTGIFGLAVKQFKRVFDLNFRLQLLEEETKAKVLSSPKVVAQNKKEAKLGSIKTRSFLRQDSLGNVATSTAEQVEARLELAVTPQVTNEGSIALDIKVTKEDFGAQRSAVLPPDKSGNNISTNVLVDNGSTIVIGGIYEYNRSESVSGVPGLRNIPLIGWLFRSPYNPAVTKKEVIIFLTPRIINQKEAGLGG